MKVIVADKISERGVALLKEQAGWNVVLTTKDNLHAEIRGCGGADRAERDKKLASGIDGEGARDCAWSGARALAWTISIWKRRRGGACW